MAITITYYESANFFNPGGDVTGVAWSSGDFIVVAGGGETANIGALNDPTNANLTFTNRLTEESGGDQECTAYMWTAPATSTETAQTISDATSPTGHVGLAVWVLSPGASETFAWGSGAANLTESAPSLTPTVNDVVIAWISDWNANNPPGLTAETNSGTVTERIDQGNASTWGQWAADWNGVDAGADNWGPTSYSGLKSAQVVGVIAVTSGLSNELEGFRFEKDDAAEAGAWWAAMDTNPVDVDGPFGLRAATVFTGDPGSASFKVAGVRRVGDTFWDDPPA